MFGQHLMRYGAVSVFLALLLSMGCSNSETAPSSLLLTLDNQDSTYEVSSYKLYKRPYQKSRQQGAYQAQLLNKTGSIIQKVSFNQLVFSGGQSGDGDRIEVVIPMSRDLHQVKIYKLDGSSGHYQLNATEPMLSWVVPDSTKQK